MEITSAADKVGPIIAVRGQEWKSLLQAAASAQQAVYPRAAHR